MLYLCKKFVFVNLILLMEYSGHGNDVQLSWLQLSVFWRRSLAQSWFLWFIRVKEPSVGVAYCSMLIFSYLLQKWFKSRTTVLVVSYFLSHTLYRPFLAVCFSQLLFAGNTCVLTLLHWWALSPQYLDRFLNFLFRTLY